MISATTMIEDFFIFGKIVTGKELDTQESSMDEFTNSPNVGNVYSLQGFYLTQMLV